MNQAVGAQRHDAVPPVPGEHVPDVVNFPVGAIRFRFAEPGDEATLLAAADRGFPNWPPFPTGGTREEHAAWFIESWEAGQGRSFVAEHEGRIVAFDLAARRDAWVHGERRTSTFTAYEAVDPDYRRMYLSRWLGEWKRQRDPREVGGGFTQVEALQRNRQRRGSGAQLGNPLSVFARVFHPLHASGESGLAALKRAPGYLALQARGWSQRRRPPVRSWSIRSVTAFDERVAELVEDCARSEFDYLPDRNHAFLNWRYFDRRTGPSIGLVAEDGDGLLGYAVLRPIGTRGHIADILARPGRPDVARSLIDHGLRRLRLDGLAAVECTLPVRHPYVRALTAAGFVRLAKRSRVMAIKFGVSSRSGSGIDLGFLAAPDARMHVTIGDSDIV